MQKQPRTRQTIAFTQTITISSLITTLTSRRDMTSFSASPSVSSISTAIPLRSPPPSFSATPCGRKLSFERSQRFSTVTCDYSRFEVRDVRYRPPGTELNLLNGVSFSLPERSFGLVFGKSGSGKTTLLQLLAGLNKPTSGSICVQRYNDDGNPSQSPEPLVPERVGIVFQFPERYFVADTVLDEVLFGWPRQKGSLELKEQLALSLQKAFNWVGLNGIALDKDIHSLSGGYKRRLALAIQLVQVPDLLILDEPLAGLDWKARADVVKLLKHLKKELTILVVSHDLIELAELVDHSWRMEMGGILREEVLPL